MAALPPRVFLLSPARAGGERMGLLLNPRAGFALAWEFQQKGAALGEVFQFASGLYFRGKLAYAPAFVRRARRHEPRRSPAPLRARHDGASVLSVARSDPPRTAAAEAAALLIGTAAAGAADEPLRPFPRAGCKRAQAVAQLVLHRVGKDEIHLLVRRPPIGAQAELREGGDLPGQLLRGGARRPFGDHPVGENHLQGLLRVHRAPG